MILPRLSIAALFVPLALGLLVSESVVAQSGETEIRLREIYVPDTELRELTKGSPDGLVIGLEEYRELVRAAIAHRPEPAPPLPPVAATIERGNFVGTLRDDRVWVTGTLRVLVTQEGWVRCRLGAQLPGLATIRVNGDPGWVIAGEDATLLLRGRGRHEITLEQSFPVGDGDPGARLSVQLPQLTAGTLSLTVPGSVSGELNGGVLQTVATEEETTFEITLPSDGKTFLSWQRERRRDAT